MASLHWDDTQLERYSRQLVLPGWDLAEQERLRASHVLLVGCGGLGWSAALLLAGAGVGRLTLVDDDRVEWSNLPRQLMFAEADIGRSKAEVLAERATALNSDLQCRACVVRVDANNLPAQLAGVDLLLDASDSDSTRRALNTVCRSQRLPWISAAAQGFEGRLVAFDPRARGPCYACLYPQPLRNATGCASHGVFAPVVVLTGSLLAAAALRQLIGQPGPVGHLQLVDLRAGLQQTELTLPKLAGCPVCA